MADNRPSGRKRRTVGGGGNANRRGSGLGGGSVGGGRPSGGGSSSGDRASGGGGLLGILLALVLGSSASKGKGGCLKRILVLIVVVVAAYFLLKMCMNIDLLDNYSGYGTGESSGLSEVEQEPENQPETSPGSDSLTSLFSGLTGETAAVSSSSEDAYKVHEPDYTVASAAREKRTVTLGNGKDVYTVMVYMCGADLESQSGMATADLQEMVNSTIGDNVNIIVETGGAKAWKNRVVSAKTNQIYQVKQGGLKKLESDLGKKSMVDPNTLASFIQYCKKNFPADRYALIMWDHGGGSLSGFGYDELFPSTTMTLDEINDALKAGGCQFDFIGFDACLMATLETALVAEQYSDYLIASEATEPGTGWYYTNWITKLSENTSMSTVDIGKNIIDDFVKASQQNASGSYATLSILDLAELSGTVPDAFASFSNATSALISSDGYEKVATARSGARDFSTSSKINQIDLIHFAQNLNTQESAAFAQVLAGCVKYNRCSKNITHANGVSIYFPYNSLKSVSTAVNTYEKIGMDESYTDCIRSFASMAAGGSVVSGGSGNPLGSLLGGESSTGSLLGTLLGADMSDYTSSSSSSSSSAEAVSALLEMFLSSKNRSVVTGDNDDSWIDGELLQNSAGYFAQNNGGFSNLQLSEAGGRRVLSLTEEQWRLVKSLEMNVYLDDGECYLDLGLDNVFDWDEAGNLIMEYDGTWLSLNGQIVSYYFISQDIIDGEATITGRVPAMLNGERVNIILVFDTANPYGMVAGAQADYESTDTVMKGLIEIKEGDVIDFLCDAYAYDGTYDDTYYLGEQMTATGAWEIGNAPVGNDNFEMTYRITDIYGAQYWTPTVK